MTVKLSPVFNDAQLDANGNPYTGAQLFVYAAGSTTKQTAYQDSSAGSAHTNPIILNSRGEPPAPIWLTQGLSYKYVLTTPTDSDPPVASIRTIDNVVGVNDIATGNTLDEWVASGLTPTYVSATSFTLSGDQTSTFTAGRRIKTTNSGGSIYSTISTSAYGALTTVTVVNDTGTLDAGLSAVSYSLLRSQNGAIPNVKLDTSGNWTFQGGVSMASQTLTDAATISWNGASGQVATVTLGGNRTMAAPTNLKQGRYTLQVTQDVTGGRTLTWNAVFKMDGGGAVPQPVPKASAVSTFDFYCDGTNLYLVSRRVQPTRTLLTTGASATYTTPTGATRLLVRGVGPGGGGGAQATNAGTAGSNATSFTDGTVTLTGNVGSGGAAAFGAGGAGGTATGGDINISGQNGMANSANGTAGIAGGLGGDSMLGRGGHSVNVNTAGAAATGYGAGGAGGGAGAATNCGSGGGAGGYFEKLISTPSATYTYTVNSSGGAGGTAGTLAGGAGSPGLIIVEEYYD